MTSRTTTLSIRRLHDVADDGLSGPTTPAARLALVETLTREAFALAGEVAAAYPRHEAPVVVRPLRSGPSVIRR
jgi:hypothetical protein